MGTNALAPLGASGGGTARARSWSTARSGPRSASTAALAKAPSAPAARSGTRRRSPRAGADRRRGPAADRSLHAAEELGLLGLELGLGEVALVPEQGELVDLVADARRRGRHRRGLADRRRVAHAVH